MYDLRIVPAPGMFQAVKLFFINYFEFKGRSRRSEYWWVVLFQILLNVLFLCLMPMSLAELTGGGMDGALLKAGIGIIISLTLYGLYYFAVLIPTLALSVRRLHDVGLSGWWYVAIMVCSFIPLVNIVAAIAWIVIACRDSVPETNKWGASPKYVEEA